MRMLAISLLPQKIKKDSKNLAKFAQRCECSDLSAAIGKQKK